MIKTRKQEKVIVHKDKKNKNDRNAKENKSVG